MPPGSCHGITITWLEACMIGHGGQFARRVNKITTEKNLPDQIETIRNKVKRHEALDNNALDLLEISAFYDAMHLHQALSWHSKIFNKSLPQAQIEDIAPFAASEKMERYGGIEVVHFCQGIFTDIELGNYLDSIAAAIDRVGYCNGVVIGFALSGFKHAIGLTYEVGFGWTFMDINKWPPKTFGANFYKLKRLPDNKALYLNAFIFDELSDALYFRYSDVDYPIVIHDVQKFKHDFAIIKGSFNQKVYSLTRKDIILLIGLNGKARAAFLRYEAQQVVEEISGNLFFWPVLFPGRFSVRRSVLSLDIITLRNDDKKECLSENLASADRYGMRRLLPTVEMISRRQGISKLMLIASAHGKDIISEFSEFIPDANKSVKVGGITFHGLTPLYVAAQNGYLQIVKALIKQGANVNEENSFLPYLFGSCQMTPLFMASWMGHEDIVRYLLEQEQIQIIPWITTPNNLRKEAKAYKDDAITRKVELFIRYKNCYCCTGKLFITPAEVALLWGYQHVVSTFSELKPQETLLELQTFIYQNESDQLYHSKFSFFQNKPVVSQAASEQMNQDKFLI